MNRSVDSCLNRAYRLLRGRCYRESVRQFRRCRVCPERTLGLAEALLADASEPEGIRKAYNLLVQGFFEEWSLKSDKHRGRLLRLLYRAAVTVDRDLSRLIRGRVFKGASDGKALYLLKAFYFGKVRGTHAETYGESTQKARAKLASCLNRARTLSPDQYSIEFAKKFSSYTVLLDRPSLGGGYFLNFGGYGCVVDPGHDFLTNFYEGNRSVYDVDCIIVTHCHDDHYADLPSLFSLLHQRSCAKGSTKRVRLLLDATTYDMFKPLVSISDYVRKPPDILKPRSTRALPLTRNVTLHTLPTHHTVLKRSTGVGLDFEIQRDPNLSHLVITGDTGWTPVLEAAYRRLRGQAVTLVAHISSARPEEVVGTLAKRQEAFYSKHLCIHGLCKAIEAIDPKLLVLSEIGEELKDTVAGLCGLIEGVYSVKSRIGWLETGAIYL